MKGDRLLSTMYSILKGIAKKLPFSVRTKKFLRRIINPAKLYFLGNATSPLSNYYGFDRGNPIDRFYIENFLYQNKKFIRGTCLELLNNKYTTKYGGAEVTKSDILDIDETNNNATIIDDLRHLKKVPDNSYDCIILTQVLQFIDDVDSAVSEGYRVLNKGGVILATLPSVSRIDCISGVEGDYWRFTEASAKYLFEKKFDPGQLTIGSLGNVRSGVCFYAGFAQEDVPSGILKKNDPNFPLIVTVKAVK